MQQTITNKTEQNRMKLDRQKKKNRIQWNEKEQNGNGNIEQNQIEQKHQNRTQQNPMK